MDRTPLLKEAGTQPWVPYYSGPWVEEKGFRAQHYISDAMHTSQKNAARIKRTFSESSLPNTDRFHGANYELKSTKEQHVKRRRHTFSQLYCDRGQLVPSHQLEQRLNTYQNESQQSQESKQPEEPASLSIEPYALP